MAQQVALLDPSLPVGSTAIDTRAQITEAVVKKKKISTLVNRNACLTRKTMIVGTTVMLIIWL